MSDSFIGIVFGKDHNIIMIRYVLPVYSAKIKCARERGNNKTGYNTIIYNVLMMKNTLMTHIVIPLNAGLWSHYHYNICIIH